MLNNSNPPLVVGIDGSDHGIRALEWATDTAMSRRWPVRLVHVHEPYVPLRLTSTSAREARYPESLGEQVLAAAVRHLDERAPSLEVSTVSREGLTTTILIDELRRGRMLVLGRRGIGRFAALLAGSTTLAAAARAEGPVVVIPPTGPTQGGGGPVVVGVDGSDGGESALGLAFAEASARGTGLDVVHAWERPSAYSFEGAGYAGAAAWRTEQELAVAEATAGWQENYPDVEVRRFVDEDHAVAALVRHAADATLVVVGGRGHNALAGQLLGSITGAVIQHAPCPVVVAHDTHHARPS